MADRFLPKGGRHNCGITIVKYRTGLSTGGQGAKECYPSLSVAPVADAFEKCSKEFGEALLVTTRGGRME